LLHERRSFAGNPASQRNIPIPCSGQRRIHATHCSRRRLGNPRCDDGGSLLPMSLCFPHQAGRFGQGSRALSMWRMDLPGLLGMPDRRVFRAVSVPEAAKAYGQKTGQREKKQTSLIASREYILLILVQFRDTFRPSMLWLTGRQASNIFGSSW
jgi:hypothetical protein